LLVAVELGVIGELQRPRIDIEVLDLRCFHGCRG
jgi:hypothetical protein